MFRKVVISIALIVLSVGLFAGIVTVGSGNEQARLPFDFYYKYSLFETIYYASEINTTGYICGITIYKDSTQVFPDVPVNYETWLWIGETNSQNLSGGWIPSSQLTTVCNQNIVFPAGVSEIYIPFSTPYLYNGSNLVLMAYHSTESMWVQALNFQCQTSSALRSRIFVSDNTDPQPGSPPAPTAAQLNGQFPRTSFHFNNPPRNAVALESTSQASVSITWNQPQVPPQTNLHYKVWRLLHGQEGNEANWSIINPIPTESTFITDSSWNTVPNGNYVWAIKAIYGGSQYSEPVFTNVVVRPSPVGMLSGLVRNHLNEPIAGASIVCGDTSANSAFNGAYTMQLIAGVHEVIVTKNGYLPTVSTVTIVENQTTVWSIQLQPRMFANVNGRVTQLLDQDIGIEGVTVTLIAPTPIIVITDVFGSFAFNNLPADVTYTYTAAKPGYRPFTGTFTVTHEDLYLPNTLLIERNTQPTYVQASESTNQQSVNLIWNAPYTGDGETIHYDNGVNSYSVGFYPSGDFDAAIRFTPEDLSPYQGLSLCGVRFFPTTVSCSYSVRVWIGGSTSGPELQVVDQPVPNPVINSWNYIALATPVRIPDNEELWFGVRCNATNGFPMGVDSGPSHNWLGNMQGHNGSWNSLYESSSHNFDYDWNIQGFIYFDDTIPGQIEAPLTNNASRDLLGYRIWRLRAGQEDNEEQWTALTPEPVTAISYTDAGWGAVTNQSGVRWAVKAVYSWSVFSEPSFSNNLVTAQYGTLTGLVWDLDLHQPIQGALISAEFYSTTSAPDGTFYLPMLIGTYTVSVTAPNTVPLSIPNVVIEAEQATPINCSMDNTTAVVDPQTVFTATALNSIYPNPFAGNTTINYSVKASATVQLDIFNVKGQRLVRLKNEDMKSGNYQLDWNGKDSVGRPVASGLYYCKLTSGKTTCVSKLLKLQ